MRQLLFCFVLCEKLGLFYELPNMHNVYTELKKALHFTLKSLAAGSCFTFWESK